ncbi:hypothetical protein Q1695_008651 [Nippostrongylus brasiliensis]|nr:hypothetical protein Q1695_008651 [Nippostrongylus brasiliensis]
MPHSGDSRSSPYPLVRLSSDPLQTAASLIRFADEPTSRTVQPGQGRRGESGVIVSGRVIPSVHDDAVSSQPSSSSHSDVNVPTVSVSVSPPPPQAPTPVRRVLRRRAGVMLNSRLPTHTGVGREDRPEVITRLLRESRTIRKEAPPGSHASPKRDNLFKWVAVLEGPPDSVYSGGTFFCNIDFSMDYPKVPPKVEFLTRMYHCNVNAQGEVYIDVLNEKWKPTMNVRTVMTALMSLMYSCNTDVPLVGSIARLYLENREEFDRMARIWTNRYAT